MEQSPTGFSFVITIPGVQAEICLPLRHRGRVVGAMKVEAAQRLTDADLNLARGCARLLEDKLEELGGPPPGSPPTRPASCPG